jgi:hypothetical protein
MIFEKFVASFANGDGFIVIGLLVVVARERNRRWLNEKGIF